MDDEPSPDAMRVADLLDVRVWWPRACMGYANACTCKGCNTRQKRRERSQPLQPWEVKR